MKYKKTLLILCLLACVIFSISCVMASNVNENTIADDNEQQVLEQTNDNIISSSEEDQISSENTPVIVQSDDEDKLSMDSDSKPVHAAGSDEIVKSSSTSNSKKTTKSTLKISAPKVTKVYKKKGAFKVKVTDKKTKKPVKGVKVKIKVYDKKTKIYTLKTNRKGIVTITTKNLAKGIHKVVIKVMGSEKYKKTSVKSYITIKSKKDNSKSDKSSKIKTRIYHYGTDYEYKPDGSFSGISLSLAIFTDDDGDGDGEIVRPVTVVWGDNIRSQYDSNENVFINKYMLQKSSSFKIIFGGDSKYKGCSYTVNLN